MRLQRKSDNSVFVPIKEQYAMTVTEKMITDTSRYFTHTWKMQPVSLKMQITLARFIHESCTEFTIGKKFFDLPAFARVDSDWLSLSLSEVM